MRISRKWLRPRKLAMLAFAAVLVWHARPTPVALALGLLPIVAGEALRLWATGFLHKTESLTTAGPYAYLRHPLYLGTLLIATGLALMAHAAFAWVLYALFLLGYFAYYLPYKNRIEGARLEARFGDEYRRYAAAVPALFPRLHPYVPLGTQGRPEWGRVRFAENHEVGVALGVFSGVGAVALRWLLV
jgi:protein-S-isoprenylcysteine O-methyltransferase Ste14